MPYLNKLALAVLLSLACCASSIAGGGWTQSRGHGYFKLGQNAIYAGSFFAPDGSIQSITTVGYYSTYLYSEYGITDRLTAVVYAPFFARNTLNARRFIVSGREEPGDELNSIGDIDISAKYSLWKTDTWVISGAVLLGVPTGNPSGGRTELLQTGDGEFNQMLRLDLSRPLGQKYWASGYLAFNNRTEQFSDEYRVGLEAGYKAGSKLLVITKADLVQSLYNGNTGAAQGNTLFGNNVEYLSPSLEVAYTLPTGWGFSVAVAGAFAGKNILAAPNFGAGIFYQFR